MQRRATSSADCERRAEFRFANKYIHSGTSYKVRGYIGLAVLYRMSRARKYSGCGALPGSSIILVLNMTELLIRRFLANDVHYTMPESETHTVAAMSTGISCLLSHKVA